MCFGRKPIAACVLALSLASVGPFCAEAVGADAPVGLLLGLRREGTLRTLWIRETSDGLRLAQEWPVLVVPHGSRLCRLVTTAVTTADPDYPGSYTQSGIALDCGTPPPPPPRDIYPGCNGANTKELLFASSSHLSLLIHEESDCYGRVNSYDELRVLPAATIEGRWALEDLGGEALPAEAGEPLKAAGVSACGAADPELRGMLEVDDCRTIEPKDWAVVRGSGRWNVLGRSHGWRSNDLYYTARVRALPGIEAWMRELPPALADHELADAEDFVVAPDDEQVVVLRGERIEVARIRKGRLGEGRTIVAKHPDESIVSVEWATGRHVAVWDALLKGLAERRP